MIPFAGNCEQPVHAGDITMKEAELGILPSHGNSGCMLPEGPQ
jgi:[calcium/calmodulin-dependent protein kinase] kinase